MNEQHIELDQLQAMLEALPHDQSKSPTIFTLIETGAVGKEALPFLFQALIDDYGTIDTPTKLTMVACFHECLRNTDLQKTFCVANALDARSKAAEAKALYANTKMQMHHKMYTEALLAEANWNLMANSI